MNYRLSSLFVVLTFLVLVIGVCIYSLRDYHSTQGVLDLGENSAFLPDDGKLVVYSIIYKFGYTVTLNGNQVVLYSLGKTYIDLCSPECKIVYRSWPLTWSFEKVDGGVLVTYPETFNLID